MIPKNTLKELGPIEANIVGRLTYEKGSPFLGGTGKF